MYIFQGASSVGTLKLVIAAIGSIIDAWSHCLYEREGVIYILT